MTTEAREAVPWGEQFAEASTGAPPAGGEKTSFELVAAIDFGRNGNAEGHLGIGWSGGEDGFRWMTDQTSEIWLEHPGSGHDYVMELDLHPFVAPPQLSAQRLSVTVRLCNVAQENLRLPQHVSWFVPRSAIEAPGPIRITLIHPDACRPDAVCASTDDRILALSVRKLKLLRVKREALPGVPTSSQELAAPSIIAVPSNGEKVVFVGNCQMEAISRLYSRIADVERRDSIAYVASYEAASEAQLGLIADSDVLVQQVLDFVPKIGDLPTAGRVLLVPHITATFLWPYTGQAHPLNKPEPSLDESGPYSPDFGDTFLNRMLLNGTDPKVAVQEYLETDVPRAKRIDRFAELVLEKQRDRDRACGFSCADYIEANFRTKSIFRSPNHPEHDTALWFAGEVFGRLGLDHSSTKARLESISDELFPASEMPLHPSVSAHFGLQYSPPERRFRYFNEGRFTFEEFSYRYMRYEWNEALAEGIHLLSKQQIKEGVAKLAAAVRTAPRAAEARMILAGVLEHLGDLKAALNLLCEAVDIEPTNERYSSRVVELSERRRLVQGHTSTPQISGA